MRSSSYTQSMDLLQRLTDGCQTTQMISDITQISCSIQTMIYWYKEVQSLPETPSWCHHHHQLGMLTQFRLDPWIHAVHARLHQTLASEALAEIWTHQTIFQTSTVQRLCSPQQPQISPLGWQEWNLMWFSAVWFPRRSSAHHSCRDESPNIRATITVSSATARLTYDLLLQPGVYTCRAASHRMGLNIYKMFTKYIKLKKKFTMKNN